jgi:hypothetical protein
MMLLGMVGIRERLALHPLKKHPMIDLEACGGKTREV